MSYPRMVRYSVIQVNRKKLMSNPAVIMYRHAAHKKAPHRAGLVSFGFKTTRWVLLCYHINSTGTFCALLSIKTDFLSFTQRFETLGLDVVVMHKNIFAAIVRGNKTITLTVVKPLYCTCCHVANLIKY